MCTSVRGACELQPGTAAAIAYAHLIRFLVPAYASVAVSLYLDTRVGVSTDGTLLRVGGYGHASGHVLCVRGLRARDRVSCYATGLGVCYDMSGTETRYLVPGEESSWYRTGCPTCSGSWSTWSLRCVLSAAMCLRARYARAQY